MDRNWYCLGTRVSETLSLSARRAWIEMMPEHIIRTFMSVALRKESVDRNREIFGISHSAVVALRKESVDRNPVAVGSLINHGGSLSARRAWIEIPAGCWRESRRAVALRKESVDRNLTWHCIREEVS